MPVRRSRLLALGLALAVAATLAAVLPREASSAPTCDATWTGAAGDGKWSTAANWSPGTVPNSSSTHVCILVPGATVDVDGNYTVAGITIGTSSSSASPTTLKVDSTSGYVTLYLDSQGSGSDGILASGVLRLDSGGTSNRSAVVVNGGTLTNGGTIDAEPNQGNHQALDGNLDNTGRITANGNLTDEHTDRGDVWTSSGTITTASGATLTTGAQFLQTAGTITDNGAFVVDGNDSSGPDTFSGGTATGHPLEMHGQQVSLSGAGSATLSFDAGGTASVLDTDVPHGYTLDVVSEPGGAQCGNCTYLRLGADVTNHGTIELTDGSQGPGNPDLNANGHTLTNGSDGTIEALSGGSELDGNLTNQGALDVTGSLSEPCGNCSYAWTTSGSITVAAGQTLSIGASLSQSGGTITNNGTFEQTSGTTDVFSAGTETGNPVELSGGGYHLDVSGSGTGKVRFEGLAGTTSGTLTADVAAGYTVEVAGGPGADAYTDLYLGQDLTNYGTIRVESLSSGGGAQGGLWENGHTLTNDGTVDFEPYSAGDEFSGGGNVVNHGTIQVNGNAEVRGDGDVWTNDGTIAVAPGVRLSPRNDQYVQSSWTIDQSAGQTTVGAGGRLGLNAGGKGALHLTGGTLGGAGTVVAPVTNDGGTVQPSAGASLAVTGDYTQSSAGTLDATVASGQASRLAVSGAATLDGTLAIATQGSAPSDGQTFQVLTGSPVSGTFPTVTGGQDYGVQYHPGDVTLVYHAPPAPPPGSGGQGQGNGGAPSLSVDDVTVPEPPAGQSAPATFHVSLSQPASQPVAVHYATANGTAVAPREYDATSGTLTFAAGETQKTVVVNVKGDGTPSPDTSFTVNLSAPSGATIASGQGTGTIRDRDVALAQVTPPTGGDAGSVTLSLLGGGLTPGSTVRLTRAGETPIAATDVTSTPDARTLTAVVDLSGRPQGAWDVTVTDPLGVSVTLPHALDVVAGQPGQVSTDLVGGPAVRPGDRYVGQVVYTNSGNDDVTGLLVRVAGIPAGADVHPFAPDVRVSRLQESDGEVAIFTVPRIPASGSGAIPFAFTAPHADGSTFDLHSLGASGAFTSAQAVSPLDPGAAITAAVTSRTATATQGVVHVAGRVPGDISFAITPETSPPSAPAIQFSSSGDEVQYVFREPAALAHAASTRAPPTGFGGAVQVVLKAKGDYIDQAKNAYDTAQDYQNAYTLNISRRTIDNCLFDLKLIDEDQLNDLDRFADGTFALKFVTAGLSKVPGADVEQNDLSIMTTVMDGAWEQTLGGFAGFGGISSFTATRANDEAVMRMFPPGASREEIIANVVKRCLDVRTIDRHHLHIGVYGSLDPNDKAGPQGSGRRHWVRGDRPLPYVVDFENLRTAHAPAAQVVVTDRLDAARLDLSSVRLGPIRFGTHVLSPPPDVQRWSADEDLRPARNVVVHVDAALDPRTHVITWRLSSLDSVTGQPVSDPRLGFLPPDTSPPDGSGSVAYTVAPRRGLRTGATIANRARIVFDANAPIDTPTWTNAIDATPPDGQVVSAVQRPGGRRVRGGACPAEMAVRWAATDRESGPDAYDVYAAKGGGPFGLVRFETSQRGALFRGLPGRTYRFYAVAYDGAGNRQRGRSAVEAVRISCKLRVVGSRLRATRRGVVPVRVACARRPGGRCSGVVSLATVARRRTVRLGRARFSVRAGRSSVVAVRLMRRADRVLPARGTAPVQVSVRGPGRVGLAIATLAGSRSR